MQPTTPPPIRQPTYNLAPPPGQEKKPIAKAKQPTATPWIFATVIVLFGVFLLYVFTPEWHVGTKTPASSPTSRASRPSVGNIAAGTVTLTCADCAATGMPANIWKNQNMDRVVCRLTWGQKVERVRRSADGDMTLVRSGSCEGWLQSSLVK